MPHITRPVILRAWRQSGEADRIHYIAAHADGKERRLYVDKGNALYPILASHLTALGYTGPKGEPS